jgi:hypothetical protein
MKRIFLLALAASLFVACEKTENEEGLVRTFIGIPAEEEELEHVRIYEGVKTENVYTQEFIDPATSDWEDKTDNYAVRFTYNGQLVIQAKRDHYTWVTADWNTSNNFQIETYIQTDFIGVKQDEPQGFVFGVDNKKYNFIAFINQVQYPLIAGYYDGSNYNYWYNQSSNMGMLSYHLYTVRKFNNKMYLFVDKILRCETDYNYFARNYGFWLAKDGQISVDYVRIDYIE